MEKLSSSSHFLDLGGLDSLRAQAQKDEKGALKKVAQQFEGIFVQMLMKSMRDANAVFKSDSPLNSQYTQFYEQMRDQQLSVDLSDKGVLGLADMMVQQLSPETSHFTPASVLRDDGGMKMLHDDKALNVPMQSAAAPVVEPTVVNHGVPAAIVRPVFEPDRAMDANSSMDIDTPHRLLAIDTPKPSWSEQSLSVVEPVISGQVMPTAAFRETQKIVRFGSREEFLATLYPHAEKAAKALGTQPEVLLAQSALETGWGQKIVRGNNGAPSHNLFNIKADRRWQGDKANVSTLEFEHGVAVQQKADFRVYSDFEHSFNDFVSFIADGDRYQDAKKVAASPTQFIRALQDAGYATDPRYAEKVIKVMQSISEELKSILPGEDK
ncbi:MAG: flagellar assembly peptidoglycan hydrolase FlgJ [Gammaproteobacteria bacterium]|nr:flagellar assembly peptidoglycan hydrolase FlgJ [Gammaproteobacteria bacterium]MBU1476400.1 flagellar assembly peptidoglycan hydrolase FlgJ [Gammaproteobacteria bacterium]MBU2003134.1 flagellar assembly peptidoglycan hydrolase FlgJ [Gammaproteobacteria bacterium]MBU2130573.1 flagellar assembly peptidoglycan hydrolase FlgJ [Gammaproteobacteria bacterium]MBU2187122.1 flagellar assembly peptidoglycan hydrolase FlgJ [Gammaproteobacteria bacterium]